MKRLIGKWIWLALFTVSLLFAMNAVRLSPMTLDLRVLSEMPTETASSSELLRSDHAFNEAQAPSELATNELSSSGDRDRSSIPFYVPGEFLQLLPESPATMAIPGVLKGTVRLSNPYARFWRVTIEGTVVLANGTTQQVLHPRTLLMPPMQTLQRPVQLQVDAKHFMPGLTQFKAVLKDDQGKIIDQASIAFTLTVDFP